MLSARASSHMCTAQTLSVLPKRLMVCTAISAYQRRSFSRTSYAPARDFFPLQETNAIRMTPPAWPHHGYTTAEMLQVQPGHREPRTFGDWAAYKFVRLCRWGMDFVTGMSKAQKASANVPTGQVTTIKPLTETQWLTRFIFLESVAGVPGMVGGMLRHLNSIRRLRRDNGWIETLLEESYNERMHLLTFLKMYEPGLFMKLMIIGAQGIFFNGMFLMYLMSPRICHRFVGYLEEEAVHTYTWCIQEIEAGHLPEWTNENFVIPDIAVTYWKIPEGQRTMKDLIYYVRADEATHRGVNHTLGNLEQRHDPNPFASVYKAGHGKPNAALKINGYEREEVI
ncbi:hypothetical protein TD95_003801 [Thielaviopsis punctulata]|uniref:Alternative oxidase n=1 Tax=Thielaviopsis punctulata TaxID=72032 RepID=A0A0F4ZDX7_9PEZI|nr:hypothetical protein TD95_003801 [Thielaviopsis punctulata]